MRDQVFEVQVLWEVHLRLRLLLLLWLRLRLWLLTSVPLGGDAAAGVAAPVGL
jgi:hypothetical protein